MYIYIYVYIYIYISRNFRLGRIVSLITELVLAVGAISLHRLRTLTFAGRVCGTVANSGLFSTITNGLISTPLSSLVLTVGTWPCKYTSLLARFSYSLILTVF